MCLSGLMVYAFKSSSGSEAGVVSDTIPIADYNLSSPVHRSGYADTDYSMTGLIARLEDLPVYTHTGTILASKRSFV